jgi:hypothetical protein
VPIFFVRGTIVPISDLEIKKGGSSFYGLSRDVVRPGRQAFFF